jgi:hypothetical protein
MLLKSCNMITYNHTKVIKHRKQSQNLDRLPFATHHTAHILLQQIFTSFKGLKDAICGIWLGSDGKVTEELEKWLQVQNSN